MTASTAILLINVGTPDSPRVGDVRRYLSEFLNDGRVIDMPRIARFLLVNGIIVPFRAPRSARLYRELWTDRGSPLLTHGVKLKEKLQFSLGDEYEAFLAMRYGNPGLTEVLEEIRKKEFKRLVAIPLFPQYASSTTGTALERLMEIVAEWRVIPEIKTVGQFWDHPLFIEAFAENIGRFDLSSYDHILFSYHGLPVSHIDSVHRGVRVGKCQCHDSMPDHGSFCYRATCYATTRLLAAKLELKKEEHSVAFQSRLTKNWLTPFADQVVAGLARKGVRKLLVVAPSFVADCLETTLEIGNEYAGVFRQNGGERLDLVPGLNDSQRWIDALTSMIREV